MDLTPARVDCLEVRDPASHLGNHCLLHNVGYTPELALCQVPGRFWGDRHQLTLFLTTKELVGGRNRNGLARFLSQKTGPTIFLICQLTFSLLFGFYEHGEKMRA